VIIDFFGVEIGFAKIFEMFLGEYKLKIKFLIFQNSDSDFSTIDGGWKVNKKMTHHFFIRALK